MTKTCPECKVEFSALHGKTRFCSAEHRHLFWSRKESKKYQDRQTSELSDGYIKQSLVANGVFKSRKDIPQEAIDIQRKSLKLKRCLKQKNN